MDKVEETKLKNKIEFVQHSGTRIEHHLKNSIELELLMQLEDDGLGHWTITQLLNCLQDMNSMGRTESFYILNKRRKRICK